MLKLMLADDEPSVLEGLRILIRKFLTGYDIVGQASDGNTALTMIKQTQPDIVICDIRMPGMSGLELIEKVNSEIVPAPKFIMLSGYNDFSFAKKALQLGATGYMTKPLDPGELEKELFHAADIIENERRTNRENLELIRYAANQVYNDIINGRHSERTVRKASFIFGIPVRSRLRLIRVITNAGRHRDNMSDQVYNLISNILGIKEDNCVFYNGNSCYVVIMYEGMDNFVSCDILAKIWIKQLNSINLRDYGLTSLWVLISGISDVGMPDSILTCSRQLDRLQTWCMLHPETSVVCYESLAQDAAFNEQMETEAATILPEALFDQVVSAIKGNDAQKVFDAVEEFFDALDKNTMPGLLFKVCLYKLADAVRKTASAFEIEASHAIIDFTESVAAMDPNCKNLAHAMCSQVFEKMNQNNEKSLVFLENEIIDYIKTYFRMKNLSIQTISEKFSLPAMIISKIVKKRTGKKFNDYLNQLRIEFAKTLFATEDMKITAVCNESGYSDYGYFTKKFKEITGVLPSEYKKKYS